MTWERGKSGNPSGRKPLITAFRTLCQNYSYQAFDMLKELVENRGTHEAVRFQGLKFILESGWGRPAQAIEVRMEEGKPPDMMTTEQLKMAAAGQTEELVYSLIQSGKIDEYKQRLAELPDHTDTVVDLSPKRREKEIPSVEIQEVKV